MGAAGIASASTPRNPNKNYIVLSVMHNLPHWKSSVFPPSHSEETKAFQWPSHRNPMRCWDHLKSSIVFRSTSHCVSMAIWEETSVVPFQAILPSMSLTHLLGCHFTASSRCWISELWPNNSNKQKAQPS